MSNDISKNIKVESLASIANVGAANDTWVNQGPLINMTLDDRLLVWYDLVINDSTGVSLRILGVQNSNYKEVIGTAELGGSGTLLVRKTGTAFLSADISAGDIVQNATDGSWAYAVSITDDDNIVTSQLIGGSANTWAVDDAYSVGMEYPAMSPTMDTWALGSASDNKWIQFMAEMFPYLQIQTKATVVGATPATVTLKMTKAKV